METQTILITPQLAEAYLKNNKINRPPSRFIIDEYARLMRLGLWFEETGEAIKINSDGVLIDGQQRLMAIIKSGVSLKFLVAKVPLDAFKYIDTGKKRTARDVFACSGVLNYTNVSAGIKRYLYLKAGLSIANASIGKTIGASISNSELIALYNKNASIYQGAYHNSLMWSKNSGRLMYISDIMGFYLYFRDIDEDDAFNFMDMLFNASGVLSSSPIYLLRVKLLDDRTNTRYKIPGKIKTALILKTWNYFRKNKYVSILKFDVNREPMPVAI